MPDIKPFKESGAFEDGARGLCVAFSYVPGQRVMLNVDLWRWYFAFGLELPAPAPSVQDGE